MPRHSLHRRLFAIYAAVLCLAAAALVLAPVTVSAPINSGELVVILIGLGVMLTAYRTLLRRALAPLQRLTEVMRSVDPLAPGQRVPVATRDAEVSALAEAFNGMLDRLERERVESARRALAAQEAERRRIARELHDEIGQQLTGLLLQAEALARRAGGELGADLEQLREAVRGAAEEVRVIARRLRPEALDELGLQSALLALCTGVAEQTGLRIERRLDRDLDLAPDEELVVYRVAQEALTNVARHAGARQAHVELSHDDGGVVLAVRDDGSGLPADAGARSTGIRGMRERALLVGGSLNVFSQPGEGTTIELTMGTR
jgi:two-component system sensor histidine kinase UhpB